VVSITLSARPRESIPATDTSDDEVLIDFSEIPERLTPLQSQALSVWGIVNEGMRRSADAATQIDLSDIERQLVILIDSVDAAKARHASGRRSVRLNRTSRALFSDGKTTTDLRQLRQAIAFLAHLATSSRNAVGDLAATRAALALAADLSLAVIQATDVAWRERCLSVGSRCIDHHVTVTYDSLVAAAHAPPALSEAAWHYGPVVCGDAVEGLHM
jgi:hypothetical protein